MSWIVRRAVLLAMLLAALSAVVSFAATTQQSNLSGALNQLEETSRSFLAITTLLLLVAGAVLAAIGAAVYLMKLRGVKKRETLWIALGFLCGGLGLLLLLGGVLCLLLYLFTPSLMQGLLGTPA